MTAYIDLNLILYYFKFAPSTPTQEQSKRMQF